MWGVMDNLKLREYRRLMSLEGKLDLMCISPAMAGAARRTEEGSGEDLGR